MAETKYKYHKDGTQADIGQIFVFGSNEAGRHGAGAAYAATKNYGAPLGVGFGHHGSSFAIPTKDWIVDSLPLDVIEFYVKRFVAFTNTFRDAEFFITRVGCGLAGYKDSDIAPMFKGCSETCNFPEEWKQYLEEEHA